MAGGIGISAANPAMSSGLSGNGNSRDAVLTPDNRCAAFISEASISTTHIINSGLDVFWRDWQWQKTVPVSQSREGTGRRRNDYSSNSALA